MERVDVSSIVKLNEANQELCPLLIFSLFEAGNVKLTRAELPHIFPTTLHVILSTPYGTTAYAFALQHHTSLESVTLTRKGLPDASVNLKPLLDALSCHSTVRELFVTPLAGIAAKGECAENGGTEYVCQLDVHMCIILRAHKDVVAVYCVYIYIYI